MILGLQDEDGVKAQAKYGGYEGSCRLSTDKVSVVGGKEEFVNTVQCTSVTF